MKFFLSEMKWYRRKKGGKWFRVRPSLDCAFYVTYWINRGPFLNEQVLETEKYYKQSYTGFYTK